MKARRVRLIARRIKDEEHPFLMRSGIHDCGRPCCIAGFCFLALRDGRSWGGLSAIIDYFDVDDNTAAELYFPVNEYASYNALPGETTFVTKDHAAAVLYHLAKTGKVDWSIGR